MLRDFIKENLKDEHRNLDETELSKALQESEIEINPDVKEYADLMKKLLGTLIALSCEMAALIYQNYCVEKNQ